MKHSPGHFVKFIGLIVVATFLGEASGQPKKASDVRILVEPLRLRAGEPLSDRTPVQRPGPVNGVLSWTIETRRHRGYLGSAALSPNGKLLATGGLDGIIHIWDAATGKFVRALVGHDSYVYGLAWSPNGHTLASAGSFDGSVRLWDADTGMTLRILSKGHKGYVNHVAWSRDGKSVLTAGGNSGFFTLWDVDKPESINTAETGNAITGIAWGPGDRLVAVSGVMAGVQIWDMRDDKVVNVFQVPGVTATSVAWSPDGKTIAGGTATQTLIWEAETGKPLHTLDAPGTSLAFNSSGKQLAVSTNLDVKVWAAFDKKPLTIKMPKVRALAWSPDSTGLYGMGITTVNYAPAAEGAKIAREIEVALNFPVQLSPGRPLITGIYTASPKLWDVSSGKMLCKLEGHTGAVMGAAWSKDGKHLATASNDKTVRIWEKSGKNVKTFTGHNGPVRHVAWADSKTLASSGPKTVRVWKTSSDAGKVYSAHKNTINALAWSKDGKQLASGDQDHIVYIWTPATDKPPRSITVEAPVASLGWSPNARNLAVGLATGNTEVFNPRNGKAVQTFESGGSPPTATSLAFAPDSLTLLTGRANHTAQVWRIGIAKPALNLPCMAPVRHATWSRLGGSAVLSEADCTARVFDMPAGKIRTTVVADGNQVATISTTGNYRVGDESTCELVYVVQTLKGQETLSPKEFLSKYHRKNNPSAVILTSK